LIRELSALYTAFGARKPTPLAAPPIQYGDFAVWQRRQLASEALVPLTAYWTAQLAGCPRDTRLPSVRARPLRPSARGGMLGFELPPALAVQVAAASRQEGVTVFMTLLATLNVLLFSYSQETDLVVGSPVAGRSRVETEELIGLFLNTVALRSDLGGNPAVSEFLHRVRKVCLDAYAHQDMPFEKLVNALGVEQEVGRMPLFRVWLNYQNAPLPEARLGKVLLKPFDFEFGLVKFDLALNIVETPGGARGAWEYSSDLFDADTVAALSSRFLMLLDLLTSRREVRLQQIVEQLLESEQRQRQGERKTLAQTLATQLRDARRQPIQTP
jgi:non-ribosomal peptide synthetase component F